jgi:hypothetical protein
VVESVGNQGIFPHTGFFMVMVFGAFSKMIGGMPVQAVVKMIDLECKMLEEDVEHHRLALDGDALSILRFGRFVRMVKSGEVMRRLEFVPPDHLEFYKETLIRLVNAMELPVSVMKQFEYAFPFAE